MGFAENLMAAPAAMVRAAARGNQRDRSLSVILPPSVDVTRAVDRVSRRPRLSVEVTYLFPRLGAHRHAIGIPKGNSGDIVQRLRVTRMQRRNQFLHREFALADHN